MRALPVIVAAALVAACAPTPRTADRKGTSPESVAQMAAPAPSAPMAKRAPPQPGEKVSPVIAFRGNGEHWNLQLENAGGYAHDADLTWDDGSQQATGSLEYQPNPGSPSDTPIVLVGTLRTAAGPRSVRIEINEGACKDSEGAAYTHAVQATIEGVEPMRGCGDLAK